MVQTLAAAALAAQSWTMPTLTRRCHPERPDCWHVDYGDVSVGTIAVRRACRSAGAFLCLEQLNRASLTMARTEQS
jgi:hypothetical protein